MAVGCLNVNRLAEHLGHGELAARYREELASLREAINRYMWSEEKGVYYNYNVKENKQRTRLICTTFDPMWLNIAPPERVERLIPKLLDPNLFNWGKLPVNSLARTEPDHVEAEGPYDGRAWRGDIWTLCNLQIIAGLEDVGRHELAADLIWATIKAFNANYCEYLVPSNGSCQGVKRYGWSASQYIQAVVEHLFGLDYDRMQRRLRVVPHVPHELMGHEIAISSLIIPAGSDTRLSATIKQTSPAAADITITIDGALPEGDIEILLPIGATGPKLAKDDQGKELPIIREFDGLRNVTGVRVPIQQKTTLRLE